MTERLRLRRWRPEDHAPFAAMNADPEVMAWFPRVLTREESDALLDRIEAHHEARGFGLWAVEVPGVAPFAGFVGLSVPAFEAPFTPCVEVGWRLKSERWGRGFAPEAALASLQFGWDVLGLPEIYSWTAESNRNSRRVMEKIGMTHDRSTSFDHPGVKPGWEHLNPHVLYRVRNPGPPPRSGP